MKNITTSTPNLGYWDTRQGGRPENQDSCGFLDTKFGLVVVVCDGMGGGPAGKQASTLAVQQILGYINQADEHVNPKELLEKAVEQAHHSILIAGERHPELKGMGSTVVTILLHRDAAYIAHVGDSRVYQFRRGRKIFRTADHSWVADMVRNKALTEEQARLSSQTNIITRALGGGSSKADVAVRPYEKGDRFMLCTDGIWGVFDEKLLSKTAAQTRSLAGAVDALVISADETGRQNGNHHDNLTLALLETNQDSKIKEKMSRKVLRIIIGLIASLMVCLVVIIVLAAKLSVPNPYEKEVAKKEELLAQKDKTIKELEDSVLHQKNKVADAVSEAAEVKAQIAKERQEAAEKAKREVEEAQKKAQETAAKVADESAQQVTTSTEAKKLKSTILEKLGKLKNEKDINKCTKIIKGLNNDLNAMVKKDPHNKQIYFKVYESLKSPSYLEDRRKIDNLIKQIKQTKQH